VRSRCGMQNNRTKYLNKFIKEFWADQAKFVAKEEEESWTGWRDRLVKSILGLGKAKVSFALEMLYPVEAQVACMDTHLFQVYGLDQSKDAKQYDTIEADWVDRSKERGLAPYMARCLYWDKNQNRKNSRYWSKVLEK
jgi:thermostable 8-oxoguanine DNA glycosylase